MLDEVAAVIKDHDIPQMDPLSYEIDVVTRTVVVTYRAQPDFETWRETLEAIFADPKCQPSFHFILDRSLLSRPVGTEYIKRFVDFIDERQSQVGASRWAIVTNDLGSYGMGRMAEQLSKFQNSIRTFQDYGEAARWAGNGF